MAHGGMLTVFSYDIAGHKRRRKVARLLEDAATRVQYLAFEVSKRKADADRQPWSAIAARLDDRDRLRVYMIGADGRACSRVYGDAAPIESDEGYWLL